VTAPTRTRRLVGGALACALVFAAIPAAASAKTTITLSGSTSVFPLAGKLAKRYVKERHGKVGFRISQGGSDVGVADVGRGRVTLGMSSRDPKPGDPHGLHFNRIARDALCLITHNSNKLGNLSQAQVQQVFGGGVRSWSDVTGAKVNGTIDLFVRTAASGTQDAFQKIFMGDENPVSTVASQRSSNGLVQQSVHSDPGGIGYVSLDFTRGVHTVRYKGVACNLRNAKAGTYGGVRNFWLVSRGKAKGTAAKFIKWIRTDRSAQKIIASNWVPLT
jgi:phosphate transport system substrate-binding protein